jgi:hypothetical protein
MAQDEAAAYASAGRRFRDLSDAELRIEWIAAFRRYAATLDDASTQTKNDLSSEYLLRGQGAPLREVCAEAFALIERARIKLEEIEQMPIEEQVAATEALHKHWLSPSGDPKKLN